MNNVEQIGQQVLGMLLEDFREQALGADALKKGYEGLKIAALEQVFANQPKVDVELALKELEDKKLISTGPMVPHQNRPGSGIFVIGSYSKRIYAYLKEAGYRKASTVSVPIPRRPKAMTKRPDATDEHFYAIHPKIVEKCGSLYEAGEYAEAVEKSFKVVRDRLRELTTYETGSDAFGRESCTSKAPPLLMSMGISTKP